MLRPAESTQSAESTQAAAGSTSCDQALAANCDTARRQGTFQCGTCAGQHQHDLLTAGCNSTYIEKFCANQTCVLDPVCAEARAQGAWQCAVCIGQHLANISSSACTKEQEQSYCNFKPSPWTPGGCCSRCPYTGVNTKCSNSHASGSMGRCNATTDPHASCNLPGYVSCYTGCSMSDGHAYCENHAPCATCAAYAYADSASCKTPCDKTC